MSAATNSKAIAAAPFPRPRGIPIFSVYDGRRLLGDVYENSRGFVTVDTAGDVAGPYQDRKAAAAALKSRCEPRDPPNKDAAAAPGSDQSGMP